MSVTVKITVTPAVHAALVLAGAAKQKEIEELDAFMALLRSKGRAHTAEYVAQFSAYAQAQADLRELRAAILAV